MLADELEIDPAELRRRNFIGRDAFPHTTASGATYDSGDYERALDLALATAGYAELRQEQARRRETHEVNQIGIGVSTYVEITNGGPEGEFGEVEIQPDGSAILRTGSFSHGQGHETTFAQIVAERLGLAVEQVAVHKGDTDEIAHGAGTYGSKSTQIGGVAASQAADEVVERARILFADLFETNPADVVLDRDRGEFHVAGSPEVALDWIALARRGQEAGRLEELKADTNFQPSASTYPFGAHVAVVEVDTETGRVDLVRHVAVDDAGNVINPMGAKGIGESGTIGSTPAVHNAVIDALTPFGIRHIDMPVNGENVWRALQKATA